MGEPVEAIMDRLVEARVDLVEILYLNSAELWERLSRSGIAASGVGEHRAERGALLGGWSVGIEETAARLAAKILRGERASNIRPERSREFGLAVNLRTAKALGITVPSSVLVRATRIIE